MKLISIGLLAMCLIGVVDAVREQMTGHVAVYQMTRGTRVRSADQQTKPEEFRSLMNFQWTRAGMLGFAGAVLWSMARRSQRLDPFSPHFQGKAAVDELAATLNQTDKRM